MLSYQTVNDPEHLAMLSVFKSQYMPMDRITVTSNYILKLYDKEREQNAVSYLM